MTNLNFKIVSDEAEARKIWEVFSEHKVIDDEWDFRMAWTKPLGLDLHFIVGFDGDDPIGFLALQKNNNVGIGQKLLQAKVPFLEFFGGLDTDDNRIYLKTGYEGLEQEFLKQTKEPAILASMKFPYELGDNKSDHYNDRFEVDLEGLTDINSYIDKFSGKERRNLKSDLKNKVKGDFKIEDGNKEDLEKLFELSIKRFGENSSFNMKHRRNMFKNLYDLFKMDIFKIVVNGNTEAVGCAFIYGDVYVGLNMGYNYDIPNLGKLAISTNLERAIKFGCRIYDAGKGDNGYKTRLRFKSIPQYKLELNF